MAQPTRSVLRLTVAFHSPYDILDLDETAKPEDVKRKYRQLSLCKHSPSYLDLCDCIKSTLTKYDWFDRWNPHVLHCVHDLHEPVRFSMYSHPS